ncbi:phage tail protein [Pseudomonas fluorescens group sp. PF-1]
MIDQNSIFGGMLTTLGAAKKTNCDALGIPWEPRYMLIGDANGTDPVPSPAQTKLVNQRYRAQLNQLRVSPTDDNILIAELVLPPDVGGWWIRELALEDKDGVFSAVANVAPSYKPLLAQGSGRNQVVRMHIITSGTSNIQLKIDPAVVLATRQYVDDAVNGLLPANKVAGTYTKVTVNDRGVLVSGSNPTTLAGFGITDTYAKAEIESMIAQASALPVGAQMSFPVNNIPPGFLERDGSVKPIALYPDLAAYLGGAFNRGDEGAGNFRLPESRGEFERGWDHGRGVDVGRTVGSAQIGSYLPGDNNAQDEIVYVHDSTDKVGLGWDTFTGNPASGSVRFSSSQTGSQPNPGPLSMHGGAARPRNVAVVMCIKAWNAPINQGNIDIAALAAALDQLQVNGPVVGTTRNARMSVPAASATATFAADEVVVGDANGKTYRLRNFSQPINLAAAIKGLGTMDVGAAPASGTVAVYALYNPTTKNHGVTVVNVTGAVAPNLCAGVLPAGYTASALVSVWATTAAGLFRTGSQENRSITTQVSVLNGTWVTALVPLAMPGIPLNAKRVIGQAGVNSAAPGAIGIGLASDANSLGFQFISSSSSNSISGNFNLLVPTPGSIYYQTQSNAGATTFGVSVTQYEF